MSTLAVNTVQNLSGTSPTGVGKIIQTKIGSLASDFAGGSTSYANLGISQTITLASTSNKLLISLSTTPYIGGGNEERFELKVWVQPNGGTSVAVIHDNYWAYRTNDDWKSTSGFHQALYSPSSTAELTVTAQYKRESGSDNMHLWGASNAPSTNTLILHEVAA